MKERLGKLFLYQGIKLTFANLFGTILNMILSAIGIFVFGAILLLLLLGNFVYTFIDAVIKLLYEDNTDLMGLFSSFSVTDSPLLLAVSLLILFCYFGYQMLVQSMVIGGLYGSVVHAIFEEKGSFGAYFSYSFRNLGKLTTLQFLLLILSIPFFIFIVIFNSGLAHLIDSPHIIYFQASSSVIFFLIFCALFLHSPILIIREKVGAWKSITLSFRLLKSELYSVLFSGALFFATLALMNGLFFLFILLLLYLSGVSPSDLHFDQLKLSSIFILILGLLIWIPIVLPYSMICSMLLLVKQYKQRLHHLVSQPKTHPKVLKS